ncbi:MAG: MaoC family dehydratase [Azospirillaceae bacterium]
MSGPSRPLKSRAGRRFEDFTLGQRLVHPIPRTVTAADMALHTALTGTRNLLSHAETVARRLGFAGSPVEDLVVFHVILSRSVPDISHAVIANLGFAGIRFGVPVYPGDTLRAESEVIGLRRTRDGRAGVVWVRTHGTNQDGETVLDFHRWCLVPARDPDAPAPPPVVPEIAHAVPLVAFTVPRGANFALFDPAETGSDALWDDYAVGERIDHVDGATFEEAEHQLMTRLWQITSRIHADAVFAGAQRHGRRLVYGGHVLALARAISHNGLANALRIAAIHRLDHKGPAFGGDTIYAWSEVTDREELPGRSDLGVLRLTTRATRDRPCGDFPTDDPAVILEVDYSVLMPRRL